MLPDEELITITKTAYERLVRASVFLHALEGLRVDNWEGYSDAFRMAFDGYESEDEDGEWLVF